MRLTIAETRPASWSHIIYVRVSGTRSFPQSQALRNAQQCQIGLRWSPRRQVITPNVHPGKDGRTGDSAGRHHSGDQLAFAIRRQGSRQCADFSRHAAGKRSIS